MTELTFEEAITFAKSKLITYMEREGIRMFPNGSFRCPNRTGHKHGDAKPSAAIRTHGMLPGWACHGCGLGGDTIDMAILLDPSLPEKGSGFRHITLPAVLEKLDAKIVESEEEIRDFPTQCAIEAKTYIKAHMAKAKDLTGPEFGRNYTEEFAAAMLSVYPIARTSTPFPKNPVLHPTNDGVDILLIPIVNDGMIAGTVARHHQDTLKAREDLQKYKNSLQDPDRGINYLRVLNMDRGLREAERLKKLFIIEGVFNTLAAMASGIFNVIGVLGTRGLENVLTGIITTRKVREVVFVSDKDKQGAESTVALARSLAKIGVVSRYYSYENNGKDYDQEFNLDPEGFAEKIRDPLNSITMIEYIANYRADYMCDPLYSDTTKFEMLMTDVAAYGNIMEAKLYARAIQTAFPSFGADVKDITTRIKDVLKNRNSPLLAQLNELADKATHDIRSARTVEGKISVIDQLSLASKNINVGLRTSLKDMAKKRMAELLANLKTDFSQAFSTGFANIDNYPSADGGLYMAPHNLIGLMGKPSHAKSTISRGIFTHAYLRHEHVLPVYFTLDDSLETTMSYLISGMSRIPYRELDDRKPDTEQIRRALQQQAGERYFILDHREVTSMSAASQIYRRICDENPDKTVLLFCDNMYNLPEIARNKDNKHAQQAAVEEWIDINRTDVKDYNLSIVNTLEVRKAEGRLTDNDVKGTGAVEYRSNFMLSVYNSYKERKEASKMYSGTPQSPEPIIELHVHKAKTGKPGVLYFFKLNGPIQVAEPITEQAEISHWMTQRAGEIASQSRGGQRPSFQGGPHASPSENAAGTVKPVIRPDGMA